MRLRFEFSIRHRTLNLFTSTFAGAVTPVSCFCSSSRLHWWAGFPFLWRCRRQQDGDGSHSRKAPKRIGMRSHYQVWHLFFMCHSERHL